MRALKCGGGLWDNIQVLIDAYKIRYLECGGYGILLVFITVLFASTACGMWQVSDVASPGLSELIGCKIMGILRTPLNVAQ